MKNFRGSALAAGVGTPESAPHELLGSSLHFYLRFKHRNCFCVESRRVVENLTAIYIQDKYIVEKGSLQIIFFERRSPVVSENNRYWRSMAG